MSTTTTNEAPRLNRLQELETSLDQAAKTPANITPERLLRQLNWRYAAKHFDPTLKIPADIWSALEQALVLTPSSGGLQPWKFVVVTDLKLRKQLHPDPRNHAQVLNCSHLVAFAARIDMTEADIYRNADRVVEVRGVARDSLKVHTDRQIARLVNGPIGVAKELNSQQLHIALGNFLTSAALLGVDTCALGGIDGPRYDQVLGLDKLGYKTYVAAAAGYRSAEDKNAGLRKVRFPEEDVLIRR